MNEEGTELALDLSTIFLRETYHRIAPDAFPEVEHYIGRPLNVTEDTEYVDEYTSSDGHRIVSVNEVFEDSQGMHFRVIDTLGNGTYSYVFKCQVASNPEQFVAMKVLKNQPQYRATGLAEIAIHQKMMEAPDFVGKEHVGSPISTFEIDNHVCMVMPLYQRSLFEGIGQDDPMNLLATIRMISTQLLQALNFVHHIGIIHCDVKPDNIMYANEANNNILLIDFGSATDQPTQIGQYIQSRFYRSPEIMLGLPFSNKIDIWSVGCVVVELYLDFAIFACDSEIDSIHSMVALLGPIDQNIIARSRGWWKFYDMSQEGYTLKMDPFEVLLTRHLYHENVFAEIGVAPLHQMLLEHFPLQSQEEIDAVNCFSHFAHCLLNFNQDERLSAAQALQHPFITGAPFSEDWTAPSPEEIGPPPLREQAE